MASTSRPGDGGRRKRPAPPTIELSATEIASAAAEEKPAQEKPADPGPESVSQAGSPVSESSASGASSESSMGEPGEAAAPSRDAEPDASPRAWDAALGMARDWRGVGVAAALLMFLLVGGLWFADAFRTHDPMADLGQHLARLQHELGALREQPRVDPQQARELGERIAAAETALKRFEGPESTGRLSALSTRVEKLEQAAQKLKRT